VVSARRERLNTFSRTFIGRPRRRCYFGLINIDAGTRQGFSAIRKTGEASMKRLFDTARQAPLSPEPGEFGVWYQAVTVVALVNAGYRCRDDANASPGKHHQWDDNVTARLGEFDSAVVQWAPLIGAA
jgi:hypothetical protein